MEDSELGTIYYIYRAESLINSGLLYQEFYNEIGMTLFRIYWEDPLQMYNMGNEL